MSTTRKTDYALDAVNFMLADVRGAVGPYLNVFLVTQQHWTQSNVGLVTMISGLIGLIFQTPIGAAIDETHAKRGVLILSVATLGASAIAFYLQPSFWVVAIALVLMAVVGDVFGPATAALTLGLYPRQKLAMRMGRNSALDHAGNIFIAIVAGAVGYQFSQRTVFLLVPICALLSAMATLAIPGSEIDYERARGNETTEENSPSSSGNNRFGILFRSRPLLILGLSIMLFHFANAPLLPLVGQKLAYANPKFATAMMSACIIAAQFVMLPLALLVGRKADQWGRKPFFLAAFAILPVRAFLYPLSNDTAWLLGVQLLDGVGAGILGALLPLAIADLTKGTPHYNFTQGAIATVQGIGASVSGFTAGLLVDHFGYNCAFAASGISALLALTILVIWMPETRTSLTIKSTKASTN